MHQIFNRHRNLSLVFFMMGAVTWWYAIILLTNPVNNKVVPDTMQWFGLLAGVIISVLGWICKCLTVIPT